MKSWLTYIPFRIAAGLFGFLPEPVVRRLGEIGGGLAYRRDRERRPLLTRHMRRVLGSEATDDEVASAVEGMYRSYGRYWTETFWFRARRKTAISQRVERINFDPIFEAKRLGKGIVFAVPHMGNWEIAGIIANEIGVPIVAVAEHLPNERITQWFIDVRAEFDIDIVLTTDPRLRSTLVRTLKDKGTIALLADRDITGRGIEVEFFGERTTIPAGPVALADVTDSALIPVAVYFQQGAGHRIVVHDAVELSDDGNRAERVSRGAQTLAKVLEGMIREAPSQWHLFQPNWPSDVDGEDR